MHAERVLTLTLLSLMALAAKFTQSFVLASTACSAPKAVEHTSNAACRSSHDYFCDSMVIEQSNDEYRKMSAERGGSAMPFV